MPGSTAPPFLLLVSTWLPEDLRPSFAEWCDAHHRGLLTVPGVRRARRADRASGSGGTPDVLTMYELDDLAITTSDRWRDAGFAHGPLPGEIVEELRSVRRDLHVLAALPHSWWPPRPARSFDVFTLADPRRVEPFERAITELTDASIPTITMRLVGGDDDSPLVVIDHHDDTGDDFVDDITGASGATRSRWTIAFDESTDATAGSGTDGS